MAYEHKEGRGSFFDNDKKTSDKSPDYRGKFKLNGKLYSISIWTQDKGYGFTVQEWKDKPEWPANKPAPASEPAKKTVDANGDEIPF